MVDMSPINCSLPPESVPASEPARREWIKYQLRVRGLSLASLAAQHNKSRKTIQKALDTPSANSEQIIAKALRIKAARLWPDRYDKRGRRIKRKRGPKPRAEKLQRLQ